jgi:high-affinity nickel-transport protein
MTEATLLTGAWTPAERIRIGGILAVIVGLHVSGIALYLAYSGDLATAGGVAGTGVLAYVLGTRHAFDADHIAAIDDTTRIMLLRGRRPVGVGFFFAMGHSTVVVVLALLVAWGASSLTDAGADRLRELGGAVATVVAMLFLLIVAALNAVVLRTIVRLWRRLRTGEHDAAATERALLSRGALNRLLGRRFQGVVRSSWHMYPVGLLMGLGLETASEVTLLALAASTAAGGQLPVAAVLSLPLLFAAGMSTFDTADSLVMTRLYSWSYRNPVRTLFFNISTTAMTVLIAAFIASVYLADVLVAYVGWTFLAPYAALAENFELFGYCIAGLFALTWLTAFAVWKVRRYDAAPEVTR